MNNKHRIAVGIAALIGTLTILPAITVDAASRPSPDFNKRPKPAVVDLPCPAVDDVAQCGLHVASNTTNVGASAKSSRSPAVVDLPCPAVDEFPLCDLHVASNTTHVGTSASSPLSAAVASGGGTGTLDPARITASPR